jgi:hypothetical protein
MADDSGIRAAAKQAAEVMAATKERRRMAQPNVTKEMHARVPFAKLR